MLAAESDLMSEIPRVLAIVQARQGSSRLPGKSLARIGPGEESLLEAVIARLKLCREVHQIVIATTTNMEDDAIEAVATKLGVSVYRGSQDDVLARYFHAASLNSADVIVRITADDPFKDPLAIDEMIKVFEARKLDYLANNFDPSLPEGLDIEVISFKALQASFNQAGKAYEREHVTQWIRNRGKQRFRIGGFELKEIWPECRLTVDHPADMDFTRQVLNTIPQGILHQTADLRDLLLASPSLIALNLGVAQRNEGLELSKKNSKEATVEL
jgi:spore coat polysaccharide biosynthesis protein SpsF (cytidylyltransferase family)